MQIDIISDTICPWCFVGKRRLEKAMAQRPALEFEITWRPFQLNPEMPESGMDRETYVTTKFGGNEQARQFYKVIGEAGEAEDINFVFGEGARVPNTIDSHRLIRWAGSAGVQDAVVEALFQKYFQESADIGEHEVLIAIAEGAGMDKDLVAGLLERGDDKKLVADEDLSARKMGISGVPCFIIGQKYSVMGANEPAAFHSVFDQLLDETD